jgi:hypothetical protein
VHSSTTVGAGPAFSLATIRARPWTPYTTTSSTANSKTEGSSLAWGSLSAARPLRVGSPNQAVHTAPIIKSSCTHDVYPVQSARRGGQSTPWPDSNGYEAPLAIIGGSPASAMRWPGGAVRGPANTRPRDASGLDAAAEAGSARRSPSVRAPRRPRIRAKAANRRSLPLPRARVRGGALRRGRGTFRLRMHQVYATRTT